MLGDACVESRKTLITAKKSDREKNGIQKQIMVLRRRRCTTAFDENGGEATSVLGRQADRPLCADLSLVVDGLCAGEKRLESIQGLWRAFGHAAIRKRAGMHATARARSRYKQTTRASRQWGVCRHVQECRQRTIQYEQELESTQETIRNHAMQCSGRSLGGTIRSLGASIIMK